MSEVPKYCKYAKNHYIQTLTMSCGPTSAANFAMALMDTDKLSSEELEKIVHIALKDEDSKDAEECLNNAGFEGYGLGKAIAEVIGQPKESSVEWTDGNAEMAAETSTRRNPTMMVVQYEAHEHWVVCVGKGDNGKVYFQDPAHKNEVVVPVETVKDGNYNSDGSSCFKQNGYYSFATH